MTGSPIPDLSDDPVVNFCLHEVIADHAGAAREKEAAKQRRENWKTENTDHLESVE